MASFSRTERSIFRRHRRRSAPLPKIFISYRRKDHEGSVGRLADRLETHFGSSRLFLDVKNVSGGEDFFRTIEEVISMSPAMLVVVGPNWLPAERTVASRLDDPKDLVRIELEAAIRHRVPLIPVLLEDTPPLSEPRLPESLKVLAHLHALPLRHESWDYDYGRILDALEDHLTAPQTGGDELDGGWPLQASSAPDVTAGAGQAGRGTTILMALSLAVLGALGLQWFMPDETVEGDTGTSEPTVSVPTVARPLDVAFATGQTDLTITWSHDGGAGVSFLIQNAETNDVLVSDLTRNTYTFSPADAPSPGACVMVAAVLAVDHGLKPISYSDPVCR